MTESSKHLIIDLAKCDQCHTAANPCGVECSYFERFEDSDDSCGGMLALREKATFELICRRCEHASCVIACPFDALERVEDGIIKRHNLRCVSCKSCAIACPFGTIYMELLPFYSMSYESSCHQCLADCVGARHARDRGHGPLPQHGPLPHKTKPACAGSCQEGALEYREIGPDEADIHIIDEFLAAKVSDAARAWSKQERAP